MSEFNGIQLRTFRIVFNKYHLDELVQAHTFDVNNNGDLMFFTIYSSYWEMTPEERDEMWKNSGLKTSTILDFIEGRKTLVASYGAGTWLSCREVANQ